MSDIICIYHANCADGFTAAWAVWKIFPEAEFHPGVYGQEPPDVKGKRVILVDFSYKPDVLKKMAEKAKSMLILDHHKSAIEEIKAFKNPEGQLFVHMSETYTGTINWQRHLDDSYQDYCENIPTAIIYTVFDMERSGAMIAWQFFHPEEPVPELIKHVQDRDLWRFELENTREIQSCVFSYEYTFKNWNDLVEACQYIDSNKMMVAQGAAIERKHFKDISELVAVSKREMNIGGHVVWVVNLPYTMASDACHSLCELPMIDPRDGRGLLNPPVFGASYYDTAKGRTFSLRSIGEFDVSEIAKKYGGGGHKNAAGFQMPICWEGETG